MALFDDNVKKQLSEYLSNMVDKVSLVYFTQEFECNLCKDTRLFVEEISALTDKLDATVYDFQKDNAKAKEYGVEKIPAIVVLDKDKKDTGIRFYGLPGGYEINSFMASVLETSGKKEEIPEDIASRIAGINKDVHIQVFVTLQCPYCPAAVAAAHRLALDNPKVKGDMVDSAVFPQIANRYNVTSVPKIIINDKHELEGAQPLTAILDVIDHV